MAVLEHTPDRYYRTFGVHEPAAVIDAGDTVRTHTLDAEGFDGAGGRPGPAGNPLVGPFVVRDCRAGDVLSVAIERIQPAGSHGWSAAMPAVALLEHAMARRVEADEGRIDWALDGPHGEAAGDDAGRRATATTELGPRLGSLSVPMQVMLGCIGTAPGDGQRLLSRDAGPHGGNLDCRRIRPGCVLQLPVFVDGGYLFIGDGHAAQGDGELLRSGIECAMEVTLTVNVEPGPIGRPRGRDAELVFALGSAHPLDAAFRAATTEMLELLMSVHELTFAEASALLGVVGRYELANGVSPVPTAVCGIDRQWLEAVA